MPWSQIIEKYFSPPSSSQACRRGLLLLLTSGLEQNTVLPSEEVGGRLWELLFTVGAPRGRKKEVFLMFKLNPFTQKHLSQIFLSLLSLVMSWHWQVLKSQYFQINFSYRFCFCPKNCPFHSSLSKVVKKSFGPFTFGKQQKYLRHLNLLGVEEDES